MKNFEVKFESSQYCGVWEKCRVTAPDDWTEDMVANHLPLATMADDWMLENNQNDDEFDEDGEYNAEYDEDVVCITVTEMTLSDIEFYPEILMEIA
jgi:hypothetical protein